jgi:hypothetical protein
MNDYILMKNDLEIPIVMARRVPVEQLCVGDLHPGLVRIELNHQECATAQSVHNHEQLIGQEATCSCEHVVLSCASTSIVTIH